MPNANQEELLPTKLNPDLPYLTDNTRIKRHQQCPRSRYYNNEFDGRGIVLSRNSIALSKGLAIHKGVESLNKGLMNRADPSIGVRVDVEGAVSAALREFDSKASAQELQLEEGTTENYTYHEQRALIEFATRGYAHTRIPYHQQLFKIVSVEKEHLLQLTPSLILMGRTDGNEQKLSTQGIYVFEFKTTFAWDELIAQEYSVDLQGLSSLIQVEAELAEIGNARVDGINMEFFLNGSRKQDKKGEGEYKQQTWTIRPWMKTGAISGVDFKWKYWFKDQFGNNHNLGKTYQRVNIWEIMSIKEWVELLATGTIQSDQGDPFQAAFISPNPYQRDESDVSSFITEVIEQESNVRDAVLAIQDEESESEKQRLLDKHFPRYRHSCINKYRKVCPYWQLCWGGNGLKDDPVGSGVFQYREPHHDAERVLLGGESGDE